MSRLTIDNLEEKETRRYMRTCSGMLCRCHNWITSRSSLTFILGGKSRADHMKLFTCSGCKFAMYCVRILASYSAEFFVHSYTLFLQSKECQKADWPRHKPDCRLSRLNKEVANSSSSPSGRAPLPPSLSTPLPSDVTEELYAFQKHFIPTLTLAAVNAFCDFDGMPFPRSWQDHLFLCQLERLPNCSPSTPPWARFRLHGGGVIPVDLLFPPGGKGTTEAWRAGREQAVHRNLSMGFGTLTISASCNYQGMGLTSYVDMQFQLGMPIEAGAERVKDWKEVLAKNIAGGDVVWMSLQKND